MNAQADDWDPRTCVIDQENPTDVEFAAGVVYNNSVEWNWSEEVAECVAEEPAATEEDEEEDEEEGATYTSSFALATMAMLAASMA